MKRTLLLLGLTLANFSFGQIQNGLIAAFKFQGNLNDQSTSGITTINAGINYSLDNLGNSNGAIQLNGTTYAYFNSNAVKVSFPLTISVWVKLNDINNSNPIFTSDNVSNNYYGYFLNTVAGTGQVGFNFSAGLGSANSSNRRTYVSDLTLTQGQWHHVTAVATSANNVKIYIDCQLSTGSFNGSGSNTMIYSSSESRIGSSTNSSPMYMNGQIDELMIWNRALNANELSSLCNSYLTTNETEPIECKLFPNPVRNTLNIELDASNEIKDVIVYDNMGRAIIISELDKLNNSIDISQCPEGVLLIEIHTSNGIIRRKVVKAMD